MLRTLIFSSSHSKPQSLPHLSGGWSSADLPSLLSGSHSLPPQIFLFLTMSTSTIASFPTLLSYLKTLGEKLLGMACQGELRTALCSEDEPGKDHKIFYLLKKIWTVNFKLLVSVFLLLYSFHLDHCGALPWFLEKVRALLDTLTPPYTVFP